MDLRNLKKDVNRCLIVK